MSRVLPLWAGYFLIAYATSKRKPSGGTTSNGMEDLSGLESTYYFLRENDEVDADAEERWPFRASAEGGGCLSRHPPLTGIESGAVVSD